MKKNRRKILSVLLAVVLIVALLATGLSVGANSSTMDLDGDGKLTVHDIQLAREADGGIRTLSNTQEAAIAGYSIEDLFNELFGRTYSPAIVDGVYQIASVKDLHFVQANSTKGYSFLLTQDIDLEGIEWMPIDQFSGSFDGGKHTIKNLVITTGRKNSNTSASVKNLENQGFFAEIMKGATVKDLYLENVEITASADAMFIGLLAGTNRGVVEKCYTHGKITDQRETVTVRDGGTKIAALIGRNVQTKENDVVVDGYYTTVSDRYATEPVTSDGEKYVLANGEDPDKGAIPIAAQLAVDVADREDIQVCLSFNAPTNSTVTQFQEISGTYGVSEEMQLKQDKVVDYMYQEATVQWSTSTDLVLVNEEDEEGNPISQTTWTAGTTYTGIPFGSMHNSLERFLYVTEDSNSDGILEINGELANVSDPQWYISNSIASTEDESDYGSNGWVRYIGNDCSSAISWAWLQISPVSAYRTSDDISFTTTTETGVFVDSCRHIFANSDTDTDWNSSYGHKHGITKIGNYNFFSTNEEGEIVESFIDANTACKNDMNGDGVVSARLDGKYATTSADIWEWNADTTKTAENQIYHTLYETYGQARKGDAIHCWFTGDKVGVTFSEDTNENGVLDEGEDLNNNGILDTDLAERLWEGHMRLIVEDPVIIREYNGYVDIQSSYLITHEHGGYSAARKTNASNNRTSTTNSWGLYQKYFLADLDYSSGDLANKNDSSRCYLPITCPALRTETTASALTEAIEWSTTNTTAPYAGLVKATYALSEVTVEVYTDEKGENLVKSYTACALPEGGLRSSQSQVRFTPQYLRESNLAWLFPDMQSDLAADLTEGTTYYYCIKITPVNDRYVKATSGEYEWVENYTYTGKVRSFIYTLP